MNWFEELLEFVQQVIAFEEQTGELVDLPSLPKEFYDIILQKLKPDKSMYEDLMQKMVGLGKKKVEESPMKFLNGNSFITSTPMPKKKESSFKTPSILYKAFPDDSDYTGGSPPRTLEWAKSPNVKQMLYEQEYVDPERVFGKLNPVVTMQKMFDSLPKSVIDRSDSAVWDKDKLTSEEEGKYKRAMNY
eukprot:NODE_358_length_8800_cov_0.946673.p7 type:complete len:189 gc:universal NODE_358_length_8800_cov_0.946673:7486-6920(-)